MTPGIGLDVQRGLGLRQWVPLRAPCSEAWETWQVSEWPSAWAYLEPRSTQNNLPLARKKGLKAIIWGTFDV